MWSLPILSLAARNVTAVWQELDRCFRPGQHILELNCGTGVDAIHLAERGVEVLACDVAPAHDPDGTPANRIAERSGASRLSRAWPRKIFDACSDEGPFDGVFSNFGGLNCVPKTFRRWLAIWRDFWRLGQELCCAWSEAQWPGKSSGTWHGKPAKGAAAIATWGDGRRGFLKA